ncbi:MAG: protein-L-isoaspartate(D-aspartate) O-methyltransferase [Acidimicrobiaceae bacterium]|nr:protein-L-isoaspartate(D-aspartate) O-methyltransferase [Acidimicrobiaceae bacterium]
MAGSTGQLADLVAQARRYGVRDEAVLAAIGTVPRQSFVPRRLASAAFDDGPLPIGEGQTISQPAMVAMMAEAAQLRPDDRVLEVGAGSGYGALVLRALAGRVVTIERRPGLAGKARAALAGQGLGDVEVVVGDGTLGWPTEAPYDAIVVTAAGPEPPPPLLEQLAPGGRLVMPVGEQHNTQFLMRYTRTATTHVQDDGDPAPEEEYRSERLTAVRFVPLIGAHGFGPRR